LRKMVHRDKLGNVMTIGEQLHQVNWYVFGPQNSTDNNPLHILIDDKSIQFALFNVLVMCENISSNVEYQPVHFSSCEPFLAKHYKRHHVHMVGLHHCICIMTCVGIF
jgi:hypothetical protein